ncbi:tropomyosin-like [Lates japonicus]
MESDLDYKELNLYYRGVIAAQRKDQEAMLLQIEELKTELQRAETVNCELREKGACSPTVEELLQQLEEVKRQHAAEKLMLSTELTTAKQQLDDLSKELQREKLLRVQTESEKQEAVEIADALFKEVENLQKVSEERNEEEMIQDLLHREILELQQMLQKEKDLRTRAEADSATDFWIEKSFCKRLRHELQTERTLRAEAERSRQEAVKQSEALFQTLEEVRVVTEKLSAESQALADKLKQEEKKHNALVRDITELTQMLDREMELRFQVETYELEAVEVVEVLQKKIKQLRKRRISGWNRRIISPQFKTRGKR